MSISVIITTYGDDHWRDLAWSRAYPSVAKQGADEILVRHHPDLPIGPARNESAKGAGGEWLLFLDADDELEPGYVETMSAAASARWHENVMLQPSVRYVRRGRPGRPELLGPKDFRVDNYLVIGTLIRRATFNAVGGFSDYPHGFEDWSLWAKAWKAGTTVVPVPEAVYRCYVDPKSKHKQMWRDRRQQVATHVRVQHELFPERP